MENNEIIYYGGLGLSFKIPERINLNEETILSWEIKKLKGWQSSNLVIIFDKTRFEQPIGLIVNYKEVLKFLKKHYNKVKNK